MKLIDFSNAVFPAEQPVMKQSLEFWQAGFSEMGAAYFNKMVKGKYVTNDMFVLWGCGNTGSGSNFIIGAGAVYYNGVYYEVDAVTFTAGGGQTAVASFITTQDAVDPIKMRPSGTQVNVHNIKKVRFTSAISGTGLADYSALVRRYETEASITLSTQTTASTTYVDATGLTFTTPNNGISHKWRLELKGHFKAGGGSFIGYGGEAQILNDTDSSELDSVYVFNQLDTGFAFVDVRNPFYVFYEGTLPPNKVIKIKFKSLSVSYSIEMAKAVFHYRQLD